MDLFWGEREPRADGFPQSGYVRLVVEFVSWFVSEPLNFNMNQRAEL